VGIALVERESHTHTHTALLIPVGCNPHPSSAKLGSRSPASSLLVAAEV